MKINDLNVLETFSSFISEDRYFIPFKFKDDIFLLDIKNTHKNTETQVSLLVYNNEHGSFDLIASFKSKIPFKNLVSEINKKSASFGKCGLIIIPVDFEEGFKLNLNSRNVSKVNILNLLASDDWTVEKTLPVIDNKSKYKIENAETLKKKIIECSPTASFYFTKNNLVIFDKTKNNIRIYDKNLNLIEKANDILEDFYDVNSNYWILKTPANAFMYNDQTLNKFKDIEIKRLFKAKDILSKNVALNDYLENVLDNYVFYVDKKFTMLKLFTRDFVKEYDITNLVKPILQFSADSNISTKSVVNYIKENMRAFVFDDEIYFLINYCFIINKDGEIIYRLHETEKAEILQSFKLALIIDLKNIEEAFKISNFYKQGEFQVDLYTLDLLNYKRHKLTENMQIKVNNTFYHENPFSIVSKSQHGFIAIKPICSSTAKMFVIKFDERNNFYKIIDPIKDDTYIIKDYKENVITKIPVGSKILVFDENEVKNAYDMLEEKGNYERYIKVKSKIRVKKENDFLNIELDEPNKEEQLKIIDYIYNTDKSLNVHIIFPNTGYLITNGSIYSYYRQDTFNQHNFVFNISGNILSISDITDSYKSILYDIKKNKIIKLSDHNKTKFISNTFFKRNVDINGNSR